MVEIDNLYPPTYNMPVITRSSKSTAPPVKIDFSKMKPKLVSAPITFQSSVKEDIEVLKKQNQELRHEIEALTAEINNLNARNYVLTERIRDPFKSAMSRPNF